VPIPADARDVNEDSSLKAKARTKDCSFVLKDNPGPRPRTTSLADAHVYPHHDVFTCMQDGAYFLALVDREQNRIYQLCCRTELHMEEPNGIIPEEGWSTDTSVYLITW